MYIQEIAIDTNTKIDRDEIVNEFGLLMSFYSGSGHFCFIIIFSPLGVKLS